MITESQLDFIRKKINEIEHGKITIVIQDGGAKLDILTGKRDRVLREDGSRQLELIDGGPPCRVKVLRPSIRINSKQDEKYRPLKKGPQKTKLGVNSTKTEEKNVRKTHGYD